MADQKISQMTDGGTAQNTDQIEVNRGGSTRRVILPNGAFQGGDVEGAASSVADNIVTFADSTGKVLKDSGKNINNILEYTSVGVIVEPTLQDNGDGSVTVGTGTYVLNSLGIDEGENLNSYELTGSTFLLTDQTTNYILADYNTGSPLVKVTTDVSIIDESKIIPVFTIVRTGTVLHVIDWDTLGILLANKLHASIVKTERFRRQSGLALSEYGTQNVRVEAGVIWIGANSVSLTEVNSAVDNMIWFYNVSGVWTTSSVTTYNNSQYDDGTDLQTVANNQYAVNFIYRGVENQKHVYMFLGMDSYTLSEAEAAQPPNNIPSTVSSHAVLVGKIIVLKNATTATTIQSAFEIPFNQSIVTEHNNLSGLQGGEAGQYNHLNNLFYNAVINNRLYNIAKTFYHTLQSNATANRTQQLQDADGIIALLSDIVSYTFTNGVTESGGTVKWGGVLTEDTSVASQEFVGVEYEQYYISIGSTGASYSGLLLSDVGAPLADLGSVGLADGGRAILKSKGGNQIEVQETSLLVTDTRTTPRGLGTAADYSANVTDNDYITKKYFDNNVPSGGTDENVKVSAADTTAGKLSDKQQVGDEFTNEIVNPSANENLLLKFKGWIYNAARTFKHILQSNSTADRTITMPDNSGTMGVSGMSETFEFGGQAHAGNNTETFSAAKTFDFLSGNIQAMVVTGDTTINITDSGNAGTIRVGTYIIELEIDSAASPTITIGASLGNKSNESADISNADNDVNILTIVKTPNHIGYAITTFTP